MATGFSSYGFREINRLHNLLHQELLSSNDFHVLCNDFRYTSKLFNTFQNLIRNSLIKNRLFRQKSFLHVHFHLDLTVVCSTQSCLCFYDLVSFSKYEDNGTQIQFEIFNKINIISSLLNLAAGFPEMAQDVSDDVCDSWEDMIENGILEKKIEELQMKTPKINSTVNESSENLFPQMRLEDSARTPYIPQVKILKRPNDAKSVGVVNDRSPSRQPVKTLMQRKAEYAEARLRILGSAHSEEEDQTSSNSSPVSVNTYEKKNEGEVVVLRLPRGPDGTNGFFQQR